VNIAKVKFKLLNKT